MHSESKSREFRWYALKLAGICAVVFALSRAFPGFFYSNLALTAEGFPAKPWTLLTHVFMHGGFLHLFSNMFALSVFGSILEKHTGSRRFLLLFFLASAVSSLTGMFFYKSVIGASGVIFTLLGCLAVLKPKTIVWVLGVPMYIMVAVFLWMLLDVAGIFYPDNVAHLSHIFGLVFGLSCGLWMRKNTPPERRENRREEVISEKELEEWEERYMLPRSLIKPVREERV
ncbi:MAG TPA: rhomboid family intramembrane serine protease [Candidatus Aenigmarchaeota archaeon]|nr:rhomboid family intramembrane serine protease [Candidatus Aenigmarchaeota archaeon]